MSRNLRRDEEETDEDEEEDDDEEGDEDEEDGEEEEQGEEQLEEDDESDPDEDYDEILEGEADRAEAIRQLRNHKLGIKPETDEPPGPNKAIPYIVGAITVVLVGTIIGFKIYFAVTPLRCFFCQGVNWRATDSLLFVNKSRLSQAAILQKKRELPAYNYCEYDQSFNATECAFVKTCQMNEKFCGVIRIYEAFPDGELRSTFSRGVLRDCFGSYPLRYRFEMEHEEVVIDAKLEGTRYTARDGKVWYFNATYCDTWSLCNGNIPKQDSAWGKFLSSSGVVNFKYGMNRFTYAFYLGKWFDETSSGRKNPW